MSRHLVRRAVLFAAFLVTTWIASPFSSGAAAVAAEGRVIVLGFDGADARTIEAMMDAGQLPNLQSLREQGTFGSLSSTVPCESPVSWASLNSGQNPGKTDVQGFVKREHYAGFGPAPGLGLRDIEDRTIDSFELGGLEGFLARFSAPAAASVIGGVVFVLFLLVFLVLLRIKGTISFVLALILGGVGAWGGGVMAGYLPSKVTGIAGNPAKAGGFWEEAARAGVECVVLDAAMAWDRPEVEGARVLAGLGVPDIRGQNGDWFVYTTDPEESKRAPVGRDANTAGTVFRVDETDGRIESAVFGPPNFWKVDRLQRELDAVEEAKRDPDKGFEATEKLRRRASELGKEIAAAESERMSLPLVVERLDDPRVRVTIGGESQELAGGEWSDWFHLTFDLNPLIKVHALSRVKVVSHREPLELFVGILQIDPSNPPFWQPVSQPVSFSKELADAIDEPYETVGWSCLTMPYKDSEIDEATFLEDIQFTQGWREKLMFACLERGDWQLLFAVESTVDRVQHMLYQYYDPEHPLYDAQRAAREVEFFGERVPLSDAIPATYRSIDRLVGKVMNEHLRPDDTLILCSDHGFQSARRQVNINNWLEDEGYLTLKPGVSSRDRTQLMFVDWSNTRAYSLGLGMIFLNLRGREAYGTVDPADAPALIAEIEAKLLALQDDDGTPAVLEVYTTTDIHSGEYTADEADIMTGFAAGYRVSWRTTLGGIRLKKADGGAYEAGPIFEDNTQPWSGGHVSMATSIVEGIFFCNRKVDVPEGGFDLLDIAPTALSELGVAVPPEYDRAPLVIR